MGTFLGLSLSSFLDIKSNPIPLKKISLVIMEVIVITTLCIGLSVLLIAPCASLQIQLQPWLGQAHDDHLISLRLRDAYDDLQQKLIFSKMPRKLRLIQVKRDSEKDCESQHHKKKGDWLSGKRDEKEAGLKGGTMQEWMEGADMSQFFTMDYTHVRRRRPIHNKSLPVGP